MADAPSSLGPGRSVQGIPLLTTKLYIPPARPGLVPRPRLTQRLNQGLDRKLILISAPAGFGKSTLLSEWRTTSPASEMPFDWVSLDERDNDPVRFWTYVIAALEGVEPKLSEGAGAVFRALQSSPSESALEMLINDLATVRHDFALVLDDYHVITNEAIHQSLTFLIEYMPPQMRLAIASRTEPPLSLTFLRGRGQLAELRGDDLRFTPDETAEFLNQVMGLDLTPEQIVALDARTEGWIVGLQMAAISMHGQDDLSELIAEFSGDNRYILDYLIEQVLGCQTGQIQTFLLQTSILDQMCGSLCEAVTGQEDGQVTLEALESANLFLIPLDNRRRWYRYHHLFVDVLSNRLRQAEPDLVPELHCRASEWYEENGLLEEAIDHAIAARDFDKAADLVAEVYEAMRVQTDNPFLRQWLAILPEAEVRSRPRLCQAKAILLSFTGQFQTAKAWLDQAELLLSTTDLSNCEADPGLKKMRFDLATNRILLAGTQGDIPRIAEVTRQLLDRLPEDDATLRQKTNAIAGMAYMQCGEAAAAERALTESVPYLLDANDSGVLVVMCNMAWVQWSRGHSRQAMETLNQVLHLSGKGVGLAIPSLVGVAHVWVGGILYEWNDLDAAKKHLLKGVEIGKSWNSGGILWLGYGWLSAVCLAQGDVDSAAEARNNLTQLELQTVIVAAVRALQARYWLIMGDLEAASRWAQESGLKVNDDLRFFRNVLEYPTLARVLIAQGKPGEAMQLLERLLQQAEAQGRTRDAIEILALLALALQARGSTAEAGNTLAQAVLLAEPEGFIRTFVDEGEPMAKLLRHAASQGIAPQYTAKLLAAFDGATGPVSPASQPLVEPLSTRELEVLRLITAGLSNQEIADDLVVGVSTVKKHINNIYGKLEVGSRILAVARARELNLLGQGG